jgi:hypothetical protein
MTAEIIPLAIFQDAGWNISKIYVVSPEGIAPCILASGWKDQIKVAL